MIPPVALFVCNGSPAIGAGHLSRCSALAQSYEDAGWSILFAGRFERLDSILGHFPRVPLERSADAFALRRHLPDGCDLLVLDDYDRGLDFEKSAAFLARTLLVFDDCTGRNHACDVLVDAATPDADVYRELAGERARILAGPAFALIRNDIAIRRPRSLEARRGRPLRHLLISMGASDPTGATAAVLDALNARDWDFAITVATSSAADQQPMRTRLDGRGTLEVDADMGRLMAEADLAIGTGGVSAFERAALGLPSIIVTVAPNQRGVVRLLTDAGAAEDVGNLDEEFPKRMMARLTALIGDDERRDQMALAASRTVDGRGALRIRLACAGHVSTPAGAAVTLRAAEPSDEEWLLDLQREPSTRRFARNPEPPTSLGHAAWLSAKLASRQDLLVIVDVDSAPAGMVRLDRLEGVVGLSFEVSIAIGPDYRAKGVGLAALQLLRRLYPAATFDATVLPDNLASLRLFETAGYTPVERQTYRSSPTRDFVRAD